MNFARKITWRVSKTGLWQTCLWLISHVDTRYRERSRKIETGGKLPVDAIAVDDCNGYEPIMYECLDALFRKLPVSKNDVLIDYGSGKGRVVIEACRYPFQKIIGVEYEKQLVEQSLENIKNFNPTLLDHKLEIVHCDAQQYDIPASTSHIFIWNSFVGSVLENVAKKILEHLESRGTETYLVVALPVDETESLKHFESLGPFEKVPTRFWTGVDMHLWKRPNG